jgi:hypothetical protein
MNDHISSTLVLEPNTPKNEVTQKEGNASFHIYCAGRQNTYNAPDCVLT